MGERKLAAILVADAVDFSRMTGADEAGTLRRLQSVYLPIFREGVAEQQGRIFKYGGDSVLAEFKSAVEAVRAAVAIQTEIRRRHFRLSRPERMSFRIGVHSGEVEVVGDDLLGADVNLAARLQTVAPVGGVAVSDTVHAVVQRALPSLRFADAGAPPLKNMARPVRVHTWTADGAQAAAAAGGAIETLQTLFGRRRTAAGEAEAPSPSGLPSEPLGARGGTVVLPLSARPLGAARGLLLALAAAIGAAVQIGGFVAPQIQTLVAALAPAAPAVRPAVATPGAVQWEGTFSCPATGQADRRERIVVTDGFAVFASGQAGRPRSFRIGGRLGPDGAGRLMGEGIDAGGAPFAFAMNVATYGERMTGTGTTSSGLVCTIDLRRVR